MKGNIKNILFAISIFYSIVVIILMSITFNNLTSIIELEDSKENRERLEEYKQQLSTLEQNNCTNVIHKIIKHYEETSYDGEVSLKEMYDYDFDNSLLSYYIEVKSSCNLDGEQEKKYNLPTKFITSSIQRDELYEKYYFEYELKLSDYSNRLIIEPLISNVEYQINRAMELEIISDLIEISSREVSINE